MHLSELAKDQGGCRQLHRHQRFLCCEGFGKALSEQEMADNHPWTRRAVEKNPRFPGLQGPSQW